MNQGLKYHPKWIHPATVTCTCLVWIIFGLYFGLFMPLFKPKFSQSSFHIMTVEIWTIYALMVDTIVSLVCFVRLSRDRMRLSQPNGERARLIKQDLVALIGLFSSTWIGIGLIAISALFFGDLPDERRFIYRLGFTFSTLQYSGGMVK